MLGLVLGEAVGAQLAAPTGQHDPFELIGEVEALVIALNRAVDMVVDAPSRLQTSLPIPRPVTSRRKALLEIRNAFEHIDERALGEVRGRPNPEALTVFDQGQLLERGTIRYGPHRLSLGADVPMLLRHSRKYIRP